MRIRPYKEKHLVLDNESFFLKERRFSIENIVSLYFHYVQTQKYVNLNSAGIEHDVEVRVYLRGEPRPILLTAGPLVRIGSGGRKPSELLIAKFDYLRKASFQTRSGRYLTQFENKGFFLYDRKQVCKNGDVISEDWKFNLNTDRPILKRPFVIFHEKPGTGLFRRRSKYEINTRFDGDVFFAILANQFDLRWS